MPIDFYLRVFVIDFLKEVVWHDLKHQTKNTSAKLRDPILDALLLVGTAFATGRVVGFFHLVHNMHL